MSWMVMSDQRLSGNNRTRETAFYGAEAGMESMTADMGNIFATQGSSARPRISRAPKRDPPVIPGISYTNASGDSRPTNYLHWLSGGARFAKRHDPSAKPLCRHEWTRSPRFTLTVAAQTGDRLRGEAAAASSGRAIPVFQFGISRRLISLSSPALFLILAAAFTPTVTRGWLPIPARFTCETR